MAELRPFSLIRDGDQWARTSFNAMFLDYTEGCVELGWTSETRDSTAPVPKVSAGLAFDNECRLYRGEPEGGRVVRWLWAVHDPLHPQEDQPGPIDLITDPTGTSPIGDFAAAEAAVPLQQPCGVAVDANDRLFVAETGADRILVYDLWSRRLLRRIVLPGARPTDLAAHGITVYAVLSGTAQIVRLTARAGPLPWPMPKGCTAPSRIALSPGGLVAILERAGTAEAHVRFAGAEREHDDFPERFASDIEWESDSVLVVACRPGADFRRYAIAPGERIVLHPLRARGYDGRGIVGTPESVPPPSGASVPLGRRIGYWATVGFRTAVPARLVYERAGAVTLYRLDSGAYQTVWGRLFLDACIPPGTEVRAHFIVLDDDDGEVLAPRMPPPNVATLTLRCPDLSPPMPPQALVPSLGAAELRPLHRRESGRELPWAQPAFNDPFRTYEAPIDAPPGRFLWVTLELRGNTRLTPRVRCLRAEHPGHDYLRRLPRTFSRQEDQAHFLQRYLAMFEGFLGEAEARAVDRHILLDARATPDDLLPWLSSFLGLALDERWAQAPRPGGTIDARRDIIAEAAWLFRYRGTVMGLMRFIELYVGVPVICIEHFRLRGIGGAMLGTGSSAFSNSVLGAGFRIGGTLGEPGESPLAGTVEDGFRTHAHRFTVIVPTSLDREQLDVINHILDVHRPAHTIVDVCTVAAGMRVGRGLHIGISSVVGRTGGFAELQLGHSALGRAAVLGRPESGIAAGNFRLGEHSWIG